MNKIKIKTNGQAIDLYKYKLHDAIKLAKAYTAKLQAIANVPISTGLIVDFLTGGDNFLSNMLEQASKELSEAGIKTKSIIDSSREKISEEYYQLKNDFEAEKQKLICKNFDAFTEYFVYENATIELLPRFHADVEERFTVYVTTQDGLQLFEAHKEFAKSFNNLCKQMPEFKKQFLYTFFHSIFSGLLTHDSNGDFVFNPIDYDSTVEINKKAA